MGRIIYILLISCYLFVSCQSDSNHSIKRKLPNFPTIVDTLDLEKFDFLRTKREETWLATADYDILYIGQPKDTIIVNHFLRYNPPPPPPRFSSSDTLKFVDPNYVNPLEGYSVNQSYGDIYKSWEESKINIDIGSIFSNEGSLPVLLTNTNEDTIIIGYENVLPIIMEAKDSLGDWRPIERRFIFMCGVGLELLILPPKQIVLTSTPVYKGDFKTDLRLKYGSNYSSTFTGRINYRQFESKFDENGDYKEEYKSENRID